MLEISEVPENVPVWVWVENRNGDKFWMIAENNSGDWSALTPWDEAPNYSTFNDYGWMVLGWELLVMPDDIGNNDAK